MAGDLRGSYERVAALEADLAETRDTLSTAQELIAAVRTPCPPFALPPAPSWYPPPPPFELAPSLDDVFEAHRLLYHSA